MEKGATLEELNKQYPDALRLELSVRDGRIALKIKVPANLTTLRAIIIDEEKFGVEKRTITDWQKTIISFHNSSGELVKREILSTDISGIDQDFFTQELARFNNGNLIARCGIFVDMGPDLIFVASTSGASPILVFRIKEGTVYTIGKTNLETENRAAMPAPEAPTRTPPSPPQDRLIH